jgi:predicted ATPase
MLQELTVKNFKSIADCKLPLSAINVLVGENGSGKSSFVQGLALLKQSLARNGLLLSGTLLDLGTFADVLHRPVISEEIEFGLSGILAIPESFTRGLGTVETAAEFADSWTANVQSLTRFVGYRKLGSAEVRVQWNSVTGAAVSTPQVTVGGVTFGTAGLNVTIGGGPQVSGYSPPPNLDAAIVRHFLDLINYFLAAPTHALGRFFLVPALRGIERQSYDMGEQSMLDLASPEGSLRVGQALATTILYRRELEETISSWMNRVTGRSIQGRALPPRKVSLDAVSHGQAINIVNEGFGSNQLAHLLTQLAILPGDSLLAIEEPEIHLHPAAQARLVSVLVEATLAGKNQLIVTTHSEHILYALMALVAEGTLKPEQIAIHNVANDDGTTRLQRLELDRSGRVAGGIPGFFDAHIQEFRRFLEAADKP